MDEITFCSQKSSTQLSGASSMTLSLSVNIDAQENVGKMNMCAENRRNIRFSHIGTSGHSENSFFGLVGLIWKVV